MVKEVMSNGGKYFQCGECLLYYVDREMAEKCEKWCRETKSCNLDIIKYAVEIDKDEKVGGSKEDCC